MNKNEMDMFPLGDYISLTEEEWLNKTESKYLTLSMVYNEIAKYEKILEEKVDVYLQLTSDLKWEYLKALKDSKYFDILSRKSAKFYCSSFIFEIAFIEKGMNIPVSCNECRSLLDVEEFYCKIVFILRRIELDYENTNDYLLLDSLNISFVCIGQLINYGKLQNMSKTCMKIYEWNTLNGRKNNAILLLSYFCNLPNINDKIILDLCNFLLGKGEILYGRNLLLKVENQTEWINEMLEKLDSMINEV